MFREEVRLVMNSGVAMYGTFELYIAVPSYL